VSRVAHEITSDSQRVSVRKIREIMAAYAEVEDLIRIGAYVKGTSPQVDRAIELRPVIDLFLKQSLGAKSAFQETRAALEKIAASWPY